jgi:hypothetical protein
MEVAHSASVSSTCGVCLVCQDRGWYHPGEVLVGASPHVAPRPENSHCDYCEDLAGERCRYCQIEWYYENGHDSEGNLLDEEERGGLEEVRRQHEIIHLLSRRSNNREDGRRLDEDPCGTFCRCGLEPLQRNEHRDCVGSGELQEELDGDGSAESNDEGRDRGYCVVCGVELQRGEVRYCYDHRPERKNHNVVEVARVAEEHVERVEQAQNGNRQLQ